MKERNKRIFKRKTLDIRGVFEKSKWCLVGWLALSMDFMSCSVKDFYLSREGCIRGGKKRDKVKVGQNLKLVLQG